MIRLLNPPAKLLAQHLPQLLAPLAARDIGVELGEGFGQRRFRGGLVGRQAGGSRDQRGREHENERDASPSH
ncbi:MAG TPA: hypothetical protein VFB96_24615 [Pirellulaceae bacterium]|nr:hypothetical protein [Pirellulaceae bacterium]